MLCHLLIVLDEVVLFDIIINRNVQRESAPTTAGCLDHNSKTFSVCIFLLSVVLTFALNALLGFDIELDEPKANKNVY